MSTLWMILFIILIHLQLLIQITSTSPVKRKKFFTQIRKNAGSGPGGGSNNHSDNESISHHESEDNYFWKIADMEKVVAGRFYNKAGWKYLCERYNVPMSTAKNILNEVKNRVNELPQQAVMNVIKSVIQDFAPRRLLDYSKPNVHLRVEMAAYEIVHNLKTFYGASKKYRVSVEKLNEQLEKVGFVRPTRCQRVISLRPSRLCIEENYKWNQNDTEIVVYDLLAGKITMAKAKKQYKIVENVVKKIVKEVRNEMSRKKLTEEAKIAMVRRLIWDCASRRHLDYKNSEQMQKRLTDAINDVHNGLPYSAAARKHGISKSLLFNKYKTLVRKVGDMITVDARIRERAREQSIKANITHKKLAHPVSELPSGRGCMTRRKTRLLNSSAYTNFDSFSSPHNSSASGTRIQRLSRNNQPSREPGHEEFSDSSDDEVPLSQLIFEITKRLDSEPSMITDLKCDNFEQNSQFELQGNLQAPQMERVVDDTQARSMLDGGSSSIISEDDKAILQKIVMDYVQDFNPPLVDLTGDTLFVDLSDDKYELTRDNTEERVLGLDEFQGPSWETTNYNSQSYCLDDAGSLPVDSDDISLNNLAIQRANAHNYGNDIHPFGAKNYGQLVCCNNTQANEQLLLVNL